MRRSDRIIAFVDAIWSWYAVHKRDLPWRDLAIENDTERAYHILVSEVMLQQTQVSRVIIIYTRFLERFPTLSDLAAASNKDVILAWRGMGYNSRALRLRDAARAIQKNFRRSVGEEYSSPTDLGKFFPTKMADLLSIPGIGPYTAAAIRNFAFNLPTPCIDTNIRRILHRTFVGPENSDGTWKKNDAYLLKLASQILDRAIETSNQQPAFVRIGGLRTGKRANEQRSVAQWHAALMDFGSLVQTKTNPKWDVCPLTIKGLMKAKPEHYNRMQPRRNVSIIKQSGQCSECIKDSWPRPRRMNARPRMGALHLQKMGQVKREPGRMVGSKFIPNRIFRGRIIEELRDAKRGIDLEDLGRRVCIDWNVKEHRVWLQGVLEKLQKDRLVMRSGRGFVLQD